MKTFVSIIIPTLNRAKLIGQTLESIIAQEYQNWECLIIDDGSTDATKEILLKYAEKDLRIRPLKRPCSRAKGASSCRNFGFKLSKGEYIQYLDSDDLLAPTKLSSQVEKLEKTDSQIAACGWTLFKEDALDAVEVKVPLVKNVYDPVEFLEALGKGNSFLPPHTYLTPRKTIIAAGPWDESLSNNDDAEFFTRVLLYSSGISFSPAPLVHYRRSGGNNLSNYSSRKKVLSAIKSWKLIESHLREKLQNRQSEYVQNSKGRLFNTIKNRYPLTLANNKIFFEEQLKDEKYRVKKKYILKKILKNNLRHLYRNVLRS